MLKDSFGAPWIKVPLAAVSTRAFIQWQCGGDNGMTLNRLAEVCGCFANNQESYGCHHPETVGQCLANDCPIAYIDYPEGASEEECDRYAEGYGDEIRMCLATEPDEDKGQNFGEGGVLQKYWCCESRRVDEFVEAQLPNPRA